MTKFLVKNEFSKDLASSGAIVCIDFGTALCKAAVSMRAGVDESITPLELGLVAEDPRADYRYFLSSSMYVSSERKIYFGHQALEAWTRDVSAGIARIDSPKAWLTKEDICELSQCWVPDTCLPNGVRLSKLDALTLLFAYISRQVTKALKRMKLEPHAPRRISRPVFEESKGNWVDRVLRECLGRGQVVSDSIAGRWNADGIELDDALELVKEVGQEVVPDSFIDKRTVLEPIAAGFLAAEESENHRNVSIVVDVGAGTTDVATFVSRRAIRGEPQGAAEPVGEPVSSVIAGDYLDQILLDKIKQGLGSAWSENANYRNEALGKIRWWKEILFSGHRRLQATFFDGTVCPEIKADDFEKERKLDVFSAGIRRAIETLSKPQKISQHSSIHQFLTGLYSIDELNIILAGGGANLPMVKRAIEQPLSIDHRILPLIRRQAHLSNFLNEPRKYRDRYPQLAVAIGGASRLYPFGSGAKVQHRGLGPGKQVIH